MAKIASDLNKPDGLCIVAPGEETRVLDPLPVTRLPGLGRKLGDAVLAAGIATLGELRRASDAQLWPLFGRDSQHMRDRASGRDERNVSAEREEVSISAEETFDTNVRDDGALLAALLKQADRVGERLRARQLVAGCLTLKLREPDFRTVTPAPVVHPGLRRRRRAGPAHPAALRGLARHAAGRRAASGRGRGQRSGPRGAGGPVRSTPEAAATEPKLDAAVDEIRRRFGRAALQRGGNLRERGPKTPLDTCFGPIFAGCKGFRVLRTEVFEGLARGRSHR